MITHKKTHTNTAPIQNHTHTHTRTHTHSRTHDHTQTRTDKRKHTQTYTQTYCLSHTQTHTHAHKRGIALLAPFFVCHRTLPLLACSCVVLSKHRGVTGLPPWQEQVKAQVCHFILLTRGFGWGRSEARPPFALFLVVDSGRHSSVQTQVHSHSSERFVKILWHSTWHKKSIFPAGETRFFSEVANAQQFSFVPQTCNNLDLSLLYILTFGTYSKFARKNNFPALGVCSGFPQALLERWPQVYSVKIIFQNYRWIVWFPQQKNRLNA